MEKAATALMKTKLAKQLELSELVEEVVPVAGPLTRHKRQILDAATVIRERWPNASDLAFMAKHLVQVTLPHRDPGDVPFWSRTNGDLTLVIARTQIDQETN